jgi:hypothetical protein
VFSDTGANLLFMRRSGRDAWALVQQPISGGAPRELARDYMRPGAGSREGRVVVVGYVDEATLRVGVLDTSVTPAKPSWLPEQSGLPVLSPDGRWLAFTSSRTGRSEVWVQAINPSHRAGQVSTDGGIEPLWCGAGLFYRRGDQWWASNVRSDGDELNWEPARLVFETDFIDTLGISYGLSPDCKRLLVVKRTREPVRNKLRFVTNFSAELKRLLP